MKRIILAAVLGLMFIAPANELSSTDILLTCWQNGDNIESTSDAVTIILSPEDNTAKMIDPRNRLQKGSLIVTEYFYTITIPKNTQFSKVGEIKINRFTGRFSAQWRYPESGEGNFSKSENFYGICIKSLNNDPDF